MWTEFDEYDSNNWVNANQWTSHRKKSKLNSISSSNSPEHAISSPKWTTGDIILQILYLIRYLAKTHLLSSRVQAIFSWSDTSHTLYLSRVCLCSSSSQLWRTLKIINVYASVLECWCSRHQSHCGTKVSKCFHKSSCQYFLHWLSLQFT